MRKTTYQSTATAHALDRALRNGLPDIVRCVRLQTISLPPRSRLGCDICVCEEGCDARDCDTMVFCCDMRASQQTDDGVL